MKMSWTNKQTNSYFINIDIPDALTSIFCVILTRTGIRICQTRRSGNRRHLSSNLSHSCHASIPRSLRKIADRWIRALIIMSPVWTLPQPIFKCAHIIITLIIIIVCIIISIISLTCKPVFFTVLTITLISLTKSWNWDFRNFNYLDKGPSSTMYFPKQGIRS